VKRKIRGKIRKSVYSEGVEGIERLIGRLLKKRGETVAVAESCTGGFLAHLITNIPGSSKYFRGGVVAYSDDLKAAFLKIDPELIKSKGAVSSEVARAIAEGVRNVAGTTYGIGITGIAGPAGGTPQKPVGTVHIAVAGPKGTEEKKHLFPHNREWFKLLASHTALHQLRRTIIFR